jgi:hypothetical protein
MKRSPLSVQWLGLLTVMLPSLAMAQSRDVAANNAGGADSASSTAANDASAKDSATTTTAATPAPEPSDASASAPASDVAATPKQEPAPAVSTSDIGVQRIPATGYPTYRTRGLYGGSLWLTFHGLQWPYMPKKPGEPALMLGLGGYGWVDTSYVDFRSGTPADQSTTLWRQQGRFVVRATPTYRSGDWFAQVQVELVANSNQDPTRVAPDTDDLWARAGKWNTFDVQVGRFEAWEVYHLGMGLDLNTRERNGADLPGATTPAPQQFYGADFLFSRPTGDTGNIAGHVYFTPWLRLEALTRVGNDLNGNNLGERGALIFDIGWLKAKAAAEYLQAKPTSAAVLTHSEQKGVGGALQFIFEPHVEFGANGAYGLTDNWDSFNSLIESRTWSKYSMGGFANVHIIDQLLVGGGANYSHYRNAHPNPNTGLPDESEQLQTFSAIQYGLWGQLFLKLVLGYADANFISNGFDANAVPPFHRKMYSSRLRASVYF